MTALAAVEARTGVVLGWDSGCFGTDDDDHDLVSHKGFRRERIGLAFAGPPRCLQAAEHEAQIPKYNGEEPFRWVARTLLPMLHELGRRYPELGEKDWCSALVAVGGAAIAIYPDWSLHRSPYGYVAQGSGAAWATGALAALDWLPPQGRVKRAINSAARHCTTVSEPVQTYWVPA